MSEKKYVVAIDFGSSRAGYAYSFIGKKEEDIYTCNFGDTGEKIKTLNQVIIDDDNKVIKNGYGFRVQEYLKKGNLKPNEHFFERIKMHLYSNEYQIKAVNSSKTMNLVDLIAIILEYIKKHAIEAISSTSKGLEDEYKYNEISDKIRWVLTIPAIWDEKSKDVMMKAAEKSGIVSEKNRHLFFALEPEAASYYCAKELPVEEDSFLYPYIVCDLGAGTGDIVCHERIINDGVEKIIEKDVPKGGSYGSDEINKKFEEQVLKVIFGNDLFDELNKKFQESLKDNKTFKRLPSQYVKLQNEINLFKESLDDNYNGESYEIDCSLFYKIKKGFNIKDAISNYNMQCRDGWQIKDYGTENDDMTITFPFKIIYDITKEITDNIADILISIIKEVPSTSTIFYVGGFCNSKFTVDLIKKKIKSEYPKVKHILPPRPDNAVLKGAVYYALAPERIKSRKAKYTLGMSAYLDWNSKYEDGGEKYYDEEFNKYVCKNAFYNFISKNDDIPYDNSLIKPFRLRRSEDDSYGGHLIIYRSPKIDPLFIDEDSVEEIGRFNLSIEDGEIYKGDDEIFYVTMEMGGTYLNATAYHKPSNTRVNMEFKY